MRHVAGPFINMADSVEEYTIPENEVTADAEASEKKIGVNYGSSFINGLGT